MPSASFITSIELVTGEPTFVMGVDSHAAMGEMSRIYYTSDRPVARVVIVLADGRSVELNVNRVTHMASGRIPLVSFARLGTATAIPDGSGIAQVYVVDDVGNSSSSVPLDVGPPAAPTPPDPAPPPDPSPALQPEAADQGFLQWFRTKARALRRRSASPSIRSTSSRTAVDLVSTSSTTMGTTSSTVFALDSASVARSATSSGHITATAAQSVTAVFTTSSASGMAVASSRTDRRDDLDDSDDIAAVLSLL